MKRFICLVAVCLVIPVVAGAQESANPLTATVRKVFDDYSKNVIGAAETMPAEKYNFRPTPEVRTFGATIAHVADVNYTVCAKFLTVPPTQNPKASDTDSKEKLIAALKESMDYCGQAFSKVTDDKLAEMVPWFGGRQITRLGAAEAVSYDLVDHYAGLALYLRMNDLLPPTAKKKM